MAIQITNEMGASTNERLYCIQSEPGHFYAGHLKDGTQAFIGIDYPSLILVEFDAEGNYLKIITKEISQESLSAIKESLSEPVSESMWLKYTKDWDELDEWANELGFTKGVITVKKFCLPEYEICIQDLPTEYQEMLDSDEEIDEETLEEIREWQKGNEFILVWGQDYYMNEAGEVVST